MITIYSTPVCKYCNEAKQYFKDNNIEYTELDVSVDQDAKAKMIEVSGRMGVPQIEVKNYWLVGWDQSKFEEIYNS